MAEIKYNELNIDNVFDMCAVIDAVGVKELFATLDKDTILQYQKDGQSNKDIGMAVALKVLGVIIKNLSGARNEIYKFMSGCVTWDNGSAVTVKELKSMKAVNFINIIKGLFEQGGMMDFFKEAVGLLNLDLSSSKSTATDNI